MNFSDAQGWVLLISNILTNALALYAAWRAAQTHTIVNSATSAKDAYIIELQARLRDKDAELNNAERTRLRLAVDTAEAARTPLASPRPPAPGPTTPPRSQEDLPYEPM